MLSYLGGRVRHVSVYYYSLLFVHCGAVAGVFLGVTSSLILILGLSDLGLGQLTTTPGSGVAAGDDRIYEVSSRCLDIIEGNGGALVMVSFMLIAIWWCLLGKYVWALESIAIASAAFILRSLVAVFFDRQ